MKHDSVGNDLKVVFDLCCTFKITGDLKNFAQIPTIVFLLNILKSKQNSSYLWFNQEHKLNLL